MVVVDIMIMWVLINYIVDLDRRRLYRDSCRKEKMGCHPTCQQR